MTVLVTGATGKVGRRVVSQLLAEGRAVRAGTRRSETPLEWSIIRPNWFHQNFTEGPLCDLAEAHHGVLRIPATQAKVSFIDANDIAAVTVAALTGNHGNREYDITGEQALTFTEATEITASAGLPVTAYEPVSDGEFRRSVTAMGWHPEYVDTLSGLYAVIASGANSHIAPDASELLGRPLRTLAEYAAEPRA